MLFNKRIYSRKWLVYNFLQMKSYEEIFWIVILQKLGMKMSQVLLIKSKLQFLWPWVNYTSIVESKKIMISLLHYLGNVFCIWSLQDAHFTCIFMRIIYLGWYTTKLICGLIRSGFTPLSTPLAYVLCIRDDTSHVYGKPSLPKMRC